MAFVDLTKQLAKEALLSAASGPKEQPAQPAPDNLAAAVMGQINAMQKALKEDEELIVTFTAGSERLRVMEVYAPSRQLAVLGGIDAERRPARVIAPFETLQLVCKVVKAQPGAKPARINLITPKA